MFQGTGSGVGKSVIAAGFCRLYARQGWLVAPFKAQNMSLNSGVTQSGEEMGRAQILQAQAAFTEPEVRMNPVLLKPQGDRHSQVIVQGRVWNTLETLDYYERKDYLWSVVQKSLASLCRDFDLVVIEGAGSPAEINLRDQDIVNMRVARELRCPVVIIGDIEKGGVFASLYGTWALLLEEERTLVAGFLINKFRGNERLLDPGIREIERLTGVPVLGVLPYENLTLDDEDAYAGRPERATSETASKDLVIGVVRFPHLSNFTDFQPLEAEPDVALCYLHSPDKLAGCDLVILPGSKATVNDLEWLKAKGFPAVLNRHLAEGGVLLGICGGFQMLGRFLHDPWGLESTESFREGLGFLEMKTVFQRDKILRRVEGFSPYLPGARVTGYEIHQGRTILGEGYAPFLELDRVMGNPSMEKDGVMINRSLFGTYLHGLFDSASFRRAFLNMLRIRKNLLPLPASAPSRTDETNQELDRLADLLAERLDLTLLEERMGIHSCGKG
ncbi:MAG TPA: cobyric acid synthase [Atribacteraceae bacterium]|nr:cobyric acid synthase [Atribacteraceae bacterium]